MKRSHKSGARWVGGVAQSGVKWCEVVGEKGENCRKVRELIYVW